MPGFFWHLNFETYVFGWTTENNLQINSLFRRGRGQAFVLHSFREHTSGHCKGSGTFRGLCIFTATQLSMCGGIELVNELLE